MCCHSLDILCAFAATQQKYEYPYQRDVESHLMAAIYVLSTGPTVWFQYLEAPTVFFVTETLVLLGALYQLTTYRKVVSNTRKKHKLFRLIHLAVYSSGCFEMFDIEDPHSNTTCQHWNETHAIPYMNYLCSLTCVMCATNLPIRICLCCSELWVHAPTHN